MNKDYTSEILDLITEYNDGLITDSDMQGIVDAIVLKIQRETSDKVFE